MKDRYFDVRKHDDYKILDVFFNSEDNTRYSLVAETVTKFSVHWVKADPAKLYQYCQRMHIAPSQLNDGQRGYAEVLCYSGSAGKGVKDFLSLADAERYYKFCCLKQADLF